MPKALPNAVISKCGKYRYYLQRRLSDEQKVMTFAMINPSWADDHEDDFTIGRCIGFARREKCGLLQVINLFAWRHENRDVLLTEDDPVGSENRKWIGEALKRHSPGSLLVCGWGFHPAIGNQDLVFMEWLAELGVPAFALRITKRGYPGHPSRIAKNAPLVPYTGRETSAFEH